MNKTYWCLFDENDVFLPRLYTTKEAAEFVRADLDKSWGGFKVEEVALVPVKS